MQNICEKTKELAYLENMRILSCYEVVRVTGMLVAKEE